MKAIICLLLSTLISHAATVAYEQNEHMEITVSLDEDTGFYSYDYRIFDDKTLTFDLSFIDQAPVIFDVQGSSIEQWSQEAASFRFTFYDDQDYAHVYFQSLSGFGWTDASYTLQNGQKYDTSTLGPIGVPEPGAALLLVPGLLTCVRRRR